jgi:hypothetical protein
MVNDIPQNPHPHTPGTYTVYPEAILQNGFLIVAEVDGKQVIVAELNFGEECSPAIKNECEANAYLFAASPGLLAFAKDMYHTFHAASKMGGLHPEHCAKLEKSAAEIIRLATTLPSQKIERVVKRFKIPGEQ